MEGLAIVHKGLESVSAAEINELIGATAEIEPTVVVFPLKKLEQLCYICYMARSLRRVLLLFGKFEADKDFSSASKNLKAVIGSAPLAEWIESSFKVNCERHGLHDFSSQDLAQEAGELINGAAKKPVELKNPGTEFFIYIFENRGYFGIDMSGIELDKREYRIMPHPTDVKATIAFSLVKIAGYTGKQVLLDPFARSGTNLIEAALFASNKSVNYYRKDAFAFNRLKPFADCKKVLEKADLKMHEKVKAIHAIDSSMQNLKSAEKNAKVAGVNKLIDFSRMDVSWLDTKFGKGDIGVVVSQLPSPSKALAQEPVEKLLKELFYQLEYILSDKGTCVFLTRTPALVRKHADKFSISEIDVWSGEERLQALVLKKGGSLAARNKSVPLKPPAGAC
ncbi:MAG: THUMP domain-containing protein [Candidatus Woesearchaeota archaeon]